MSPAAFRQEATAPLPDPFYEALEGLSKKFGVAFVAEGRPFPQVKSGPLQGNGAVPENGEAPAQEEAVAPTDQNAEAPSPPGESAQDAEVQKVAERFDYTAVRQGKIYLLQKRYTNPDDLPEVTPEECRTWLNHVVAGIGGSYRSRIRDGQAEVNSYEKAVVSSVNQILLSLSGSRHRVTQDEFVYRVLYGYGMTSQIMRDHAREPALPMYVLTQKFFFLSQFDRNRATISLLENSRPLDPVFHWQTLGQTPVFGYDTQFNPQSNLLFIPASDCDRINVVPYGTPLPRSDFWMRTETQLPDPDPTDPAGLSEETKKFLDDNGKSSRAVTLAEAIAAVNKQVPKTKGYKIYQVDPTYAAKRVTLVGAEKLSAETLMQSLAAVYGLGVDHRRDDHVVLTFVPDPAPSYQTVLNSFREYDKYVRRSIPAPIYRAVHVRFLAGRTKTRNQEGPQLLQFETQFEFQRIGAAFRNAAMRQFRYLAEPQVKAQPKEKLPLSRLGEREHTLFMFAQTVSAYAGECELAEIPLPGYVAMPEDFAPNVKITGGVYRKGGSPMGPYIYDPIYFSKIFFRQGTDYSCPDDSARLALFVTYVDPHSGVAYGPVQFLDVSLYLPDLQ